MIVNSSVYQKLGSGKRSIKSEWKKRRRAKTAADKKEINVFYWAWGYKIVSRFNYILFRFSASRGELGALSTSHLFLTKSLERFLCIFFSFFSFHSTESLEHYCNSFLILPRTYISHLYKMDGFFFFLLSGCDVGKLLLSRNFIGSDLCKYMCAQWLESGAGIAKESKEKRVEKNLRSCYQG